MLEEVEEALDATAGQTAKSKSDNAPVDDTPKDSKKEAAPAKEDEPDDTPAPTEHRRRPRPTSVEDDENKPSEDKPADEPVSTEENTEGSRPLRRRRRSMN